MHDDSDAFVEISTDADRKKSFRIKMKKEDERRYVYYIVVIFLYLFFCALYIRKLKELIIQNYILQLISVLELQFQN